jgi:hypothetical protein
MNNLTVGRNKDSIHILKSLASHASLSSCWFIAIGHPFIGSGSRARAEKS